MKIVYTATIAHNVINRTTETLESLLLPFGYILAWIAKIKQQSKAWYAKNKSAITTVPAPYILKKYPNVEYIL